MESAEEKSHLLSPGYVTSSESYLGTGAGKGGKSDPDSESDQDDFGGEENYDERNEYDLFSKRQLSRMRFISGCCCQNTAYYNPGDCKCCGCSQDSQLACVTLKSCIKVDTDPLWCTCSRNDGTLCFLGLGICGMGLKNCFNPEVTCIKQQAQFCCIANGCALPSVHSVPVTCGCCCMSCHPIFGCCLKFDRLANMSSGRGMGRHNDA